MTRYSLTITQSFTVTLDGEPDVLAVESIARKTIARYADLSGITGDLKHWKAETHDPSSISIVPIMEMMDSPKSPPQIEDKKPPRVDEELDIF
jgi:hypothetical protein